MAGYIPDEIIEEIRTRSDIVEVISERVPLKKSGVNFKGLCPFHTEKTPSFIVSPAKQIFHCFGCNTGGNIYQFIMKIENLSFPDAVLYLSRRYGIHIPEQKVKDKDNDQRAVIYEANKQAAEFFHGQLLESPQGKTARRYLNDRKINSDIVKLFKIGYASSSRDGIQQFFKRKGVSFDIQNIAGFIKENDEGKGYVDRFRDRIIFPVLDTAGKVVGFGGRVINNEDFRPKYLNSPETLVYRKRDILYGLHLAKDAIRDKKEVFLVEGYFDLITMYQEGIKNTVATSGTALSENHVRLLRRYTDTVTLVFDGDEAGRNASFRGGTILLNGEIKVKVIPLPSGKDPDSFIKGKGREGFLNIAKGSKSFMEYVIDRAVTESDIKSVSGKIDCVKRVVPFISYVNNSVERSVYISLLAEKTEVSERAITDEMNKELGVKRQYASDRFSGSKPLSSSPNNKAERVLVQLMLLDNKNIDKVRRYISIDDFRDKEMAKISSVIFSLSEKVNDITVSQVIDLLSEGRLKELVSELVFEDIKYYDVDKNISDCIKHIKRSRVDVKNLIRQLKDAAIEGNYKQFKELQEQIVRVKQKTI